MKPLNYVGRIHNEEVLAILDNDGQYSFDDDDPLLNRSLRRIELSKIKRATAAYKLMASIGPDCLVLFVGTKYWAQESGVDARTVLGYGVTSNEHHKSPYCFHRSGTWRHRLAIKALKFVDKRHHRINLSGLGLRKGFPPSRFFADRRGLVRRVLEQLGKRLGAETAVRTEEVKRRKRSQHPRATRRLPRIDQVRPRFGPVWNQRRQNSGGKGGSPSPRRWSRDLKRTGDRAEEVVFNHLKDILSGRVKKSLCWRARSGETPGWDIDYIDRKNRKVAVEVKGTGGSSFSNIEITGKEWEAARRLGRQFRLYLVARCRSKQPVIEALRNPKQMQFNRKILLQPTSFSLELLRR